jgi:4-hydroxy-tetrahydrodipicolinate synthase
MSAPASAPHFSGIYPMQYAFFEPDGSLDRNALERQTNACVAAGAHGIAVLGLAQEVGKLTSGERRVVVECSAACIAERVPLAVTVAEPNVAAQIEFARFASSAGAAWVILQPPPVAGVGEHALLEFFSAVMDKIEVPVAIQNAPGLIANSLSNASIAELARRHAHFRLLKAEGPATYVEQLIRDTQRRFHVFNGYAGLTLPDSLRAGCAGLIPSTDTVDVQARIFELMRSGRSEEVADAERLHRDILPILVFLMTTVENLVAYGKHLAALRLGLSAPHARQPAASPTEFGLACVQRFARQLGPLPG